MMTEPVPEDHNAYTPAPVSYQASVVEREQTSGHTAHTAEQQKELAKHKLNLPDYSANRNKFIGQKKKTNLFGNMHKKSKESFSSTTKPKSMTRKPMFNTASMERSYFVPTYVPASVIPDEKPNRKVSEDELLAAMKKEQSSYLLLDTDVQFMEKGADDPTVQKFNLPNDEPDIPVTRRQYQKIRPNMEKFDTSGLEEDFPRSRKDLKSAKDKAKSQTAYGQKVSEAEQKSQAEQTQKKGILDKSLSGIIEDSNLEMESSKYFI